MVFVHILIFNYVRINVGGAFLQSWSNAASVSDFSSSSLTFDPASVCWCGEFQASPAGGAVSCSSTSGWVRNLQERSSEGKSVKEEQTFFLFWKNQFMYSCDSR